MRSNFFAFREHYRNVEHRDIDAFSWDIKSAYKILKVAKPDRDNSWLVFWDHQEQTWYACQSDTLVFGHIASVCGWNSVGQIMERAFKKATLLESADSYFDDYSGFCLRGQGKAWLELAKALFNYFGIAVEPDKCESGSKLTLLGVSYDLRPGAPGIGIGTVERKQKNVIAELNAMANGNVTFAAARKTIGKIQHWLALPPKATRVEMQQALSQLYNWMYSDFRDKDENLVAAACDACAIATQLVGEFHERVILPEGRPVGAVTPLADASWEDNLGHVGAILFTGHEIHTLSATVPAAAPPADATSPIAVLETAVVGLAFETWGHGPLAHRKVGIFTDNSVTFFSLVKGRSRSSVVQRAVVTTTQTAAAVGADWWIHWLPSEENAADSLTRVPDEAALALRITAITHAFGIEPEHWQIPEGALAKILGDLGEKDSIRPGGGHPLDTVYPVAARIPPGAR